MKTKVVINPHYGGFMLSEIAIQRMADLGSEWAKLELEQDNPDNLYSDRELVRHDPILVQVVEELGYKAMDGHDEESGYLNDDDTPIMQRDTFEIAVVEGPRYKIREYDGAEWLETPESLDWIHIGEAK